MKSFDAFCRASTVCQGLSCALVGLVISVTIAPSAAYSQQGQASDPSQVLPHPTTQRIDSAEMQERRIEIRRERKIEWLRSASGATKGSSSSSTESHEVQGYSAEHGRMGGMSREERRQLRSDIREAGFSAYAGEGNRRRP